MDEEFAVDSSIDVADQWRKTIADAMCSKINLEAVDAALKEAFDEEFFKRTSCPPVGYYFFDHREYTSAIAYFDRNTKHIHFSTRIPILKTEANKRYLQSTYLHECAHAIVDFYAKKFGFDEQADGYLYPHSIAFATIALVGLIYNRDEDRFRLYDFCSLANSTRSSKSETLDGSLDELTDNEIVARFSWIFTTARKACREGFTMEEVAQYFFKSKKRIIRYASGKSITKEIEDIFKKREENRERRAAK